MSLLQAIKLERWLYSLEGLPTPRQLHDWSLELDLSVFTVIRWFAPRLVEKQKLEAAAAAARSSDTGNKTQVPISLFPQT